MATIAGIATGDSNFSILVSALQYVDAEIPDANLVATLNDPDASLTVFAPTNAAFGQLAADLGFAGDTTDTTAVTNFLVGAVDAATLQSVITYHVAPGVLDAAAVTAADSITTVNGAAITPDVPVLADLEPDLINPSLTATDIAADNGIVHVIDRVLLPIDLPGNDAPSITQTVAASGDGFDANPGDFDMLLAAVTAANLAGALDDPDASLTVFAPTDGAFVGLAQALGYAGSDEAGAFGTIVDALTAFSGGDPIGLLTTVLTYHVAPDALQSSQISGLSSVPTLAGAPIMPMMTTGGLALGDLAPLPDPTVAQADIQASNGIIHAIDGVLLPADLLPQDSDGDPASLLLGTDGAETLLGGDGFDFVNAKGGDDIIRTGDEADVIVAGDGADTVDAGDGDDVIRGGATEADLRDVIYAGDGNDSVTSHGGNDALFGMDGDDTLDGGLGADRIVGGDGDDVTNGGGLGDLIFGNDGDDFMNGGFGSDRLNGGDGADTFFHLGIADHGSDWIQDFAEEDELLFGGAGLSRPATADDFVLHSNTTEGAGADDVAEAFVSFRPTGQILWALVDGAGVDEISLRIAATGETVDLIA